VRVLLVTYRHTPTHRHPAQLEDTTAAYRWLLEQGFDASRVAFVGDSAGAALALTTQVRAKEIGVGLPAATMLISPWVDLELRGESYTLNRDNDPFFFEELVDGLVTMFVGEHGNRREPSANPLYADLTGLGPIYIHVGDHEQPRDDSFMLAEHATAAGVDVQVDVFPEMQHSFHFAAGRARESDDAIDRFVAWLRPKLRLTGVDQND
jgi:epsilon-lactone hydrolase